MYIDEGTNKLFKNQIKIKSILVVLAFKIVQVSIFC